MDQLLLKLHKLGIKLWLEEDDLRVSAAKGALTDDLRQAIRTHKAQILEILRARKSDAADSLPSLQVDIASRSEPFPLTELQHAYWVGRSTVIEMGGVATHLYLEFDYKFLDVQRLNDALCRVIERHDMLRAVIDSNGMQRILPIVPRYQIAVDDQSTASSEEVECAIMRMREVLSHQVLRADQWPLFDIRAILLPGGRGRLHVSIDLLILDRASISLFFDEWRELYENPKSIRPPLELSFRDYVLAVRGLQKSTSYQRSLAYWAERIETLPEAPKLPLRSDLSARKSPRFSRREAVLAKERWKKLKASILERGLTPSCVLLAFYSEVLARWSTTPHFTVNITLSNRLPLHEEVNRLFGSFTSLIMEEVDRRDRNMTFIQFARHVQNRFLNDLEHSNVSGVKVLQDWSKRHGGAFGATMPVVFSSDLITSNEEIGNRIDGYESTAYGISQTSQVWIDHHASESKGNLEFSWDVAEAVFEDGVLDAMFTAYRDLIERFADDDSLWDEQDVVALPEVMKQRREEANRTAALCVEQRIHAGFVTQALKNPQAVAFVSTERSMTYGDLLSESAAVADWLIHVGIRPGQPVAILTRKGWEQLVAVYGVLLAGGAYMPVDADLPVQRQLELLQIGEVTQVLTQPHVFQKELNAGEWKVHEIQAGKKASYSQRHAQTLDSSIDELAYVIFTSGTTGIPKGVMINHRGAMNTIEHVNRLFGIDSQGRVLAVSSLSFDLSVYDIFGLHAIGGMLVLPDYRKEHDPVHWRHLILKHGVTVWNSAPQLMRMLVDSFDVDGVETIPLRKVFLSGDFIPLDLPDRIRKHCPQAEIVSLGGATEASIWSNYHRVQTINPAWASIPYGKPLPNQTIWVYDHFFRACPDHVKGRIFIGGIGLAMGYWQDAEKTAARFIIHPKTGERLYDTGDLGRYDSDGNVIILGRDDGQIKIRGHRVELGEIEAVLRRHPAIKQAVVLLTEAASENRQLVAYVEPGRNDASAATMNPPLSDAQRLEPQAVKDYLAEHLPDYMVPRHIVLLDGIPVSANGKIDYRALPSYLEEAGEGKHVPPRNEIERIIFNAWSRVFVGYEISVTGNFFELGGDSILAVQLIRELNDALPFNLEMHELFETLTIESLALLFEKRVAGDQKSNSSTEAISIDSEAILEDIRVAREFFETMDFGLVRQSSSSPPRAVFITGGTGWIGAHLLSELLSTTHAVLYCLVRAHDKTAGHRRLIENMRQCRIEIDPSWMDRIEPICGDLSTPEWGLHQAEWRNISERVDSIYHLGATTNVIKDYSLHRQVNVTSLMSVVRLATEHHLKPVFFISPMTVCKRHLNGGLVVLSEESSPAGPEGLLTGYAQSKWAAEQILLSAAQRGLLVKIYRTSHALPSARSGLAKPKDTYGSVLKVACEVGVLPDWEDSALYGVPVDVLGRLIAEDSLLPDDYRGIIHIENRTPQNLKSVIEILLDSKQANQQKNTSPISLNEWEVRCVEAANRLSAEEAMLVQGLFTDRALGVPVEKMFSNHPIDTRYFENRGRAFKLSNLTPDAYWQMVGRNGW